MRARIGDAVNSEKNVVFDGSNQRSMDGIFFISDWIELTFSQQGPFENFLSKA